MASRWRMRAAMARCSAASPPARGANTPAATRAWTMAVLSPWKTRTIGMDRALAAGEDRTRLAGERVEPPALDHRADCPMPCTALHHGRFGVA